MSTQSQVTVDAVEQARLRSPLIWWLVTAVVGALGFLAMNLPADWWPSTKTLHISSAQMEMRRGQGGFVDGSLVIARFDPTGTAIVVPKVEAFSAKSFGAVEWNIEGGDGQEFTLIWQNSYQPAKVYQRRMTRMEGPVRAIMSGDPNWTGTIGGVALLVKGKSDSPVWIKGVSIIPLGAMDALAAVGRDWFELRPWNQTSINFWAGSSAQPWVWPLVAVALVTVGSLLAYIAWYWIRRRPFTREGIAGTLLLAWLMAGTPWLVTLLRQTSTAWEQYRATGVDQLPREERDIRRFLDTISPKLADPKARVFVFSDVASLRGMLGYHLLPRKVYADPRDAKVPPASSYRPGDYLVFFVRSRVMFNPNLGKLRLDDGSLLDVAPLHMSDGNALFQVKEAK